MKRLSVLLGVLVIFSMILTACPLPPHRSSRKS